MKVFEKIAYIAFVSLFLLNIGIYVKSLKLSSQITQLEKDIAALQIEVGKLQEEVLLKESLDRVASRAAQLGFESVENVLRIDVSKVAFKE